MSRGGMHHSWQDAGNILYEIQQDRMDPVSTLRCFDQGKIKDDGTIREINIDDYFKYLDTSAETNDVSKIKKDKLITPYYAMDVIEVKEKIKLIKANSFVHFYVREGDVIVETSEGKVRMTAGYSCFVCQEASNVWLKPNLPNSLVLKTYIP
jgi:mannose-6-phosphate isomerase class I